MYIFYLMQHLFQVTPLKIVNYLDAIKFFC